MKTHGCHNRPPFKPWHMVQDGYTASRPDADTRAPRMVKVPHRNTTACQYTQLNPNDPQCAGCEHQK